MSNLLKMIKIYYSLRRCKIGGICMWTKNFEIQKIIVKRLSFQLLHLQTCCATGVIFGGELMK